MYRGLRLIAWFLGLLLVALGFDYLMSWGRSTVLVASIEWEGETWSLFRKYGGLEATHWLLCFMYFAVAGAILASKGEARPSSIVFAILLGIAFTAIIWLDGPRVMYSHVPLWLWAMAWGDLYVPAIAGVLGVLSWSHTHVRHLRGPHTT